MEEPAVNEETARLQRRHRSVANLRSITGTLIADDVVDSRGVTAHMIKTYTDVRSAEQRLHDELMTAMREGL